MRAAMHRAVGSSIAAIAFWIAAHLVYIAVFCGPHSAWQAVRDGSSGIVLERGERVSRVGDAIFVCETTHRTGPVTWHLDLDCYCAPATMTSAAVAAAVQGRCAVDHLQPTRADEGGSCRYARCSHYLDLPPGR